MMESQIDLFGGKEFVPISNPNKNMFHGCEDVQTNLDRDGTRVWNPDDWTASDDRVRGGSSQSYLECSAYNMIANFHGNLDIKTLGGAGFASQRTADDYTSWDLSKYDGIKIDVSSSDNTLLPPNPDNGREQSTISYEYDFNLSPEAVRSGSMGISITWAAFKPTYRGKEKKDAPPLNVKDIRRFSIMMRSFFGEQEGPFSLSIRSISAFKVSKGSQYATTEITPQELKKSISTQDPEKGYQSSPNEDSFSDPMNYLNQSFTSPSDGVQTRSPGNMVYLAVGTICMVWFLFKIILS